MTTEHADINLLGAELRPDFKNERKLIIVRFTIFDDDPANAPPICAVFDFFWPTDAYVGEAYVLELLSVTWEDTREHVVLSQETRDQVRTAALDEGHLQANKW